MKNLIAQRLTLSMFVTFILAFSIQGIANALLPDTVVPPKSKPTKLESSSKKGNISVAAKNDVVISEIMYAIDTDRSQQWIELHNRSTRSVSLEGYEVTIENHPEDRTVFATTLTFTLGAKILNADQVLLLVTEQGQNSGVGEAKGDLRTGSIVILKDLIGGAPSYRLLSHTAFKVTLTAPTTTATARKMISDIAGNLGAMPEWGLPLIENERSSIIREYAGDNTSDGTTADGWELAMDKSVRYTQTTYYGHHNDYGTPGYREAASLPVELSGFRAARGKSSKFRLVREQPSDAINITWTTASEVNNVGFNIKRSQTRNGRFKVINAKMIPGAGTTNEAQSYTYADTTAEPDFVYYYQLECVSVDGTHRTLTRHTRLKGFIGASRRFEEAPFWWKDLNW